MFFAELHRAVLECLRARVKNGESTERGLARAVGISQPHLHNVLKGRRSLSPELTDHILGSLRLSLLDLIDRDTLQQYMEERPADVTEYGFLPVLQGKLGPAHPWPEGVERYERFPLPRGTIARMCHPVVARLAEDVRMHPLFADGDYVLLDQSVRLRSDIDPGGYYVVKRGRVGLVRRLRYLGRRLYMFSDDVADRPACWERLPVEEHAITYFVRARATFVAREADWLD